MDKHSSREFLKQRVKNPEREVEKTETRAEADQNTEDQFQELIKHAVAGIYRTTDKGRFLLVDPKLAMMSAVVIESLFETIETENSRHCYKQSQLK
jgi:hypothetical protein